MKNEHLKSSYPKMPVRLPVIGRIASSARIFGAGEHIGLSPLNFKKCKPSKESAVLDHLLFCDNGPSFEEFSVLAKACCKFSLEIKDSLLIKEDTLNLNRNTASVELFLFDSR